MGADDDVGTFTGGTRRRELVADAIERHEDDLDDEPFSSANWLGESDGWLGA